MNHQQPILLADAQNLQAERLPLLSAEQLLQMLTRHVGATVSLIGQDMRFGYVNASFAVWFGLTPQAMIGMSLREVYGEHNHEHYSPFVARALAGETLRYERKIRTPRGDDEWHSICLSPCTDNEGLIIGAISSALNVHQMTLQAEALRAANERLSSHIDNSPLAVLEMDAQFRLLRHSALALDLFGWHGHDVCGHTVLPLLGVEGHSNTALADSLARLASGQEQRNRAEAAHLKRDGNWVHCEWFNSALTNAAGQVTSIMALVQDTTERVQAAQQLRALAEQDSLTGLANRATFEARAQAAVTQAKSKGEWVCMIYIDLDGFKAVNDRHGHHAGDHVLRCTAQRLLGAVRSHDLVARLGGDEFVVLLDQDAQLSAVQDVAQRLLRTTMQTFVFERESIQIGASIGVACSLAHGAHAERLLNRADQAMYEAKRQGRNCIRYADRLDPR